MKRKPTKTEEANIKLNKAFYGENQDEVPDVAPLINNNNIALVLSDNNNDKDIKDS